MTRRKAEITARMNERDYPHLVELALPPGGLDKKANLLGRRTPRRHLGRIRELTAKIATNRVLFSHHNDSGEGACKSPSYAANLNTKQAY
jgi:hypothetical protein